MYWVIAKQQPFECRKGKGVQVAVLNLVLTSTIRVPLLFLDCIQKLCPHDSFRGKGSATIIESKEIWLHPKHWSKASRSFCAVLCLWHKLQKTTNQKFTGALRTAWCQFGGVNFSHPESISLLWQKLCGMASLCALDKQDHLSNDSGHKAPSTEWAQETEVFIKILKQEKMKGKAGNSGQFWSCLSA